MSRLRLYLRRTNPEWIGISLWVSLLGVALPVDIRNFRFSPSDVVLAGLIVLLLARRPREVHMALVPRTPVQLAIAALVVALAWGSVVSVIRTGVLVQEAFLNKDVGVLVLCSIVVASRIVIRDMADVRRLLRTFLIAGTIVTWLAALFNWVLPLVTKAPFEGRFDGFLLNPSANAIFLSVLLMVQIGLAVEPHRTRAPILNAVGLALLLLLTLSRSTWLAVIVALVAVVVAVAHEQRWLSAAIGVVLLVFIVFTAQPLMSVLGPVVTQVVAGQVGRFERQIAPAVTPSPDIGQLVKPSPTVSPMPPPSATAAAASTVGSVPTATSEATLGPSTGETYVSYVQSASNDRFGATDRLAFNVVALRIWFSSMTTVVAGIGLGVFLQISPQLFGTSVIIHNTYIWLPVEMGIPGIVALAALLYAIVLTGWSLIRDRGDSTIRVAIGGSLLVFLIWIGENEGLYQRTLWLVLALGSVAIRYGVSKSKPVEG